VMEELNRAENAGIKLDSVASDVLGVSGRAMLRALLAGERDPEVLADLAKGTLRRKIPDLQRALKGHFGDHHGTLIGIILDHIEHLEAAIAALDAQIDAVVDEPEDNQAEGSVIPFARARDRLATIPGVGKRAAEVIIAEIGTDMSVFPTAKHLASFAGQCPGNDRSAGKRRSGRTRKGSKWLDQALKDAAMAAIGKKGSYLQALYRRKRSQLGHGKALGAVKHSIICACWHMLTTGELYRDLGGDYFRKRDPERQTRRLVAQLERLGHTVTLETNAA